jgi:O-antigen/teichoic acid export membrane protein
MPEIARNTSYFTVALILQKVISLSYFTMYARALGPADLGQYYFAISVTSIFSIFIDLGLSNVVTREIAKYPEKARAILASTVAVKLPLAVLTGVLVIAWANALHYSPLTTHLIYISVAAMILDSFTGIFFAVARGFHNIKFESLSSFLFQLIILLLSLLVLKLGWGIEWLMVSLLTASLFNFIYSLSIIIGVWKLSAWPVWDKALIKQLFLIALPFGLFVIVQRFYAYFDSILLFKFIGDRGVGLYQVPFKIIIALQFLPMAFVASLYPAVSSYWQHNREKLAGAFERAVTYCLVLAIPVTFGAIAMSEQIVLLFKEQFSETSLLLKVSMIAVPFMFLGFPVGTFLNACDRQKRNTINMTVTAFISAGLNFILIPWFGVLGACITTVATSILMLVLGWSVIPQITSLHWKKLFSIAARIIGAGIAMAMFVLLVKPYFHPIVTIILATLVYAVMMYVLRGVTKEDIVSIVASFRKKDVVPAENL